MPRKKPEKVQVDNDYECGRPAKQMKKDESGKGSAPPAKRSGRAKKVPQEEVDADSENVNVSEPAPKPAPPPKPKPPRKPRNSNKKQQQEEEKDAHSENMDVSEPAPKPAPPPKARPPRKPRNSKKQQQQEEENALSENVDVSEPAPKSRPPRKPKKLTKKQQEEEEEKKGTWMRDIMEFGSAIGGEYTGDFRPGRSTWTFVLHEEATAEPPPLQYFQATKPQKPKAKKAKSRVPALGGSLSERLDRWHDTTGRGTPTWMINTCRAIDHPLEPRKKIQAKRARLPGVDSDVDLESSNESVSGSDDENEPEDNPDDDIEVDYGGF
ncbi:MAG: hypothetical protein LQ352_000618 [Teloschistes flavicans]|nr:MAG: hypothetical protein LQ352_000618 [Teloschistes flavicans]